MTDTNQELQLQEYTPGEPWKSKTQYLIAHTRNAETQRATSTALQHTRVPEILCLVHTK